MKKTSTTKKSRINLVTLLILLLIIVWMPSIQGQESPAAKVPSSDEVQLLVIGPSHPWRPPFGVDRVGRSVNITVTFQSKELPVGEFMLNGYLNGKKVSSKTLHLINKAPYTERIAKAEAADQITLFSVSNPKKNDIAFSGSPAISENIDQIALFFTASGKDPVELARQVVSLPSLEAEAVARPEKVINPVDLNTILVPADWLLLAGGQKSYVTVAALNRNKNISSARTTAWFNSAPQSKVNQKLPLSQGNRVQKDLLLPECSRTLEKDILHISIEDPQGKELWHKEIKVMIVPNPPALPTFGAVKTKLRYDSPIINIKNGKNVPLNYNELWAPEFQDVVVCLPNGSRWVFWRGTSYIPVWAGLNNTCLSYEWAERLSPNVGFTDCPEPLMDKELRYGRVEIVESTNARIHVRWSYQSCDFNYKVNGDLPEEDYYFYPDGFGIRALTLKSIPEAEYEVSELIVLSPPAGFPFDFMSSEPIDIISFITKDKVTLQLPEVDQEWKKISDPLVYRIRLHKNDPLSAVYFNPNLFSKPREFGPFYDKGYMVTPAYWGGHWPLSRGFNTMSSINESIWTAPAHNSLMTWGANRPKPIKSAIIATKDALGVTKRMNVETWTWLIGLTDATDYGLLQLAQSYANPPSLEVSGARQEPELYSYERRAMRLIVENKKVTIMIMPYDWCVNPVFELKNAPKNLQEIKLGGKALPAEKYAWDGNTLWLNATINQREMLELQFKE
jgi:hypothetical protein